MTLRVAHVITGLETGGGEILLGRLVERLDPAEVEGPVISLTTRGKVASTIEAAGVEVQTLKMSSRPSPFDARRLRRALTSARPEVVQTWLLHANVLGGIAASVPSRIPVVWGVHQNQATRSSFGAVAALLQRAERRMSRRVPSRIVACSPSAREMMLSGGYDASRIELIENGFDTEVFHPDAEDRAQVREELEVGPDTPLVGHVARFHPVKTRPRSSRPPGSCSSAAPKRFSSWPAIWLPDPRVREERELARFRLHLVKHKSALKNRIHSALISFGKPCPVSDLFGVEGRRLLERLEIPEPWRSNITASLALIDDLERQITETNMRLKQGHADHPYIPLLRSAPGIGWVLAFTIAAEIGEIERFQSPQKLAGYTGLCPRANQSGDKDRRGPITKHGPTYLRWAMLEATMHALKHPAYSERYQRTKRRLGKQRGAKVAQIDTARRLTHAIWHMLTRNEPFAPRGAAFRLAT